MTTPLRNLPSTDVSAAKSQYENLVLEGGGSLGVAYAGAFERLHSLGVLGGMRNFAGTSVGSLFAAALACGASFNFIMKELATLDIMSLLDYGNRFKALYNLYFYYGFCTGDVLLKWCEDLIEKLTGDKDITLRQVHEKFGGRLIIPGYCLPDGDREGCVEFFDYKSEPDMPLKIALRISTSIPIIFMPVEWRGKKYIDAGIACNYPIKVFHVETIDGDAIDPKTLGIMLTAKSEKVIGNVTSIYSYVRIIMSCLLNQGQLMQLEPQDAARTIMIDCGRFTSLNFNISAAEKEELVECGRRAVDEFFKRKPRFGMAVYADYVLESGCAENLKLNI